MDREDLARNKITAVGRATLSGEADFKSEVNITLSSVMKGYRNTISHLGAIYVKIRSSKTMTTV